MNRHCTGNLPKYMHVTTMAHAVDAIAAVSSHPPTTLSTPVILNTAFSLPHALSASDVPMATMKVT